MKFVISWIAVSLICFIILFCPGKVVSQDPAADSSFYTKALKNSMSVYHQSFGNQSAVYNGRFYDDYPFRFNEGQPYFYKEGMTLGSVNYDGILYDSIEMQYDEIADVLVIKSPTAKIRLWNENVDGFQLYNATFINLKKDSNLIGQGNRGFYHQLYKGTISLLKKQVKSTREVINYSAELLRYVDENDHYYLLKDEQLHTVNSSKELYTILGDRKEAVKQFVKANKLSFKKDRQNMLTRVTAYYDSLK